MNPDWAKFLTSALPVAAGVVTGCLPLVGVIGWFSFQQDARFRAIEQQLQRFDTRSNQIEQNIQSRGDRLEQKIDALVVSVGALTTKVAVLEAKVDGPRLVQPV